MHPTFGFFAPDRLTGVGKLSEALRTRGFADAFPHRLPHLPVRHLFYFLKLRIGMRQDFWPNIVSQATGDFNASKTQQELDQSTTVPTFSPTEEFPPY